MKWKKRIHPAWEELQKIKADPIQGKITRTGLINMISKFQWTSGKFSIVGPCTATQECYELYDGNEIYRYGDMKFAKRKAQSIMFKEKQTPKAKKLK